MTDSATAVAHVAGYADEYRTRVFDGFLEEFELGRRELLDADARTSLKSFFRLYGFDRSGETQAGYSRLAVAALERTGGGRRVRPDELWDNFVEECERADAGVDARTNRGVVTDTARLVEREGNLFRWVGREVTEHGRLTVPYDEFTSIRGIGSGVARSFLRDAVWLAGVEDGVRRQDRHRLQSMPRWVTSVAEALWPPLDGADEEVLANHVVDACADAGVSAVAFNQGAWYFGREETDGDPERIRREVRAFQEDCR